MASGAYNLCAAKYGDGICQTLQLEGADDTQLALVGNGSIDPTVLLNELTTGLEPPIQVTSTDPITGVAASVADSSVGQALSDALPTWQNVVGVLVVIAVLIVLVEFRR